jgi:hypothetical protein
MNPELNREYPEPGESELIEEMVKVAVERMKPQQGLIRRGQQAKATGCTGGVHNTRRCTERLASRRFPPAKSVVSGDCPLLQLLGDNRPRWQCRKELVVKSRGRQEHVGLFPA